MDRNEECFGSIKGLTIIGQYDACGSTSSKRRHHWDIKLENLLKDDIILVKPGEKVPADGIITEGSSYLNESMLTGESKPVKKEAKDKVIGGSVNGNSTLKVKVEHTGKDSYLNKVITMVEEAQKTK